MARRKKTVLLKTDLEDLLARTEKAMADMLAQGDLILSSLPEEKKPFYYGRRTALMELAEFVKNTRAEYLD